MLNTPPHLEARVPRGFVSIFHGTSSSVARRRLRASDLSFRQSMPSFDIGRPGLQMQSGASAVLGGVGELPGSRCTDFNPRAPWGGAAIGDLADLTTEAFQSTRPVWGATKSPRPRQSRSRISIHAPRVGRDDGGRADGGKARISIHAPRVGRDVRASGDRFRRGHFNPRAPCGARPSRPRSTKPASAISIHAPRVGRDASNPVLYKIAFIFQSTRPVWGATRHCKEDTNGNHNFNPRAPCGARLAPARTSFRPWPQFQSTRPVWGATRDGGKKYSRGGHFNPRAPCGARLILDYFISQLG